ncbi:MAG: STAS domain-containing protein [Brevinematales bacterium]|nr:STAS domain-containing protein [Brevinematales bacterium]
MKVEKVNDIFIVRLSGVINVQSSLDLETQITLLINEKNPRKVIVDFSDVQHISSSGLRVIVSFYKMVISEQGKFAISGLNSNIKKIFKIVELDTVFDIYDTLEEAIQKIS